MSFCASAMVAAKSAVSAPIDRDDARASTGASVEEEAQARDHVDAGGHHGGGVDQRARPASGPPSRRAARRRAGSAPTCRWRRRRAAASTSVDARRCPRTVVPVEQRARAARSSRKVERARGRRASSVQKSRKMPSTKPKSPMRLTMNALLPAGRVRQLLVPEADQALGAEADALPADEHQQQAVAEHQRQHREGEQVQVGEEAPEGRRRRACSRSSRRGSGRRCR